MPELRHILIAAQGITEIDASGEGMLSLLVDRIRLGGFRLSVSGLTDNVIDVLKRTHLYEKIGAENMFPTIRYALLTIHAGAHQPSGEKECPLLRVCSNDAERTRQKGRKTQKISFHNDLK